MNNYSDVFDDSKVSNLLEEFGNSSTVSIRNWTADGRNMTESPKPQRFSNRQSMVDDLSLLPPIIILITSCLLFNLIVIVVIAFEKRLHKPINAYIFSLACVDFVDGCIPMVGLIYRRVFMTKTSELFVILLNAVLDPAVGIAVLIHVMLMAYDRYTAIIHPLSYSNPNRKLIISLQVFGAYAISLAACIPPVIVYRDYMIKRGGIRVPMDTKYEVLQLFLTYVLPYSAAIYFYARCMWGIWSQFYKVSPMKSEGGGDRKKIQTEVKASDLKEKNVSTTSKKSNIAEFSTRISVEPVTMETIVAVSTDNGQAGPLPSQSSGKTEDRTQLGNSDQMKKRRNDLIRSLRNVGVFVMAFSLLIMPYALGCLIVDIWYICTDLQSLPFLSTSVLNLISWAPYAHSSVHPILFMLVTREFRPAVKSIFLKFRKYLQR